jgi:hypothetical protein
VPSSTLLAAAGVAVLALATADIFITVLHHWGGAGPLARRLAAVVWWVARMVVRPLPPHRGRLVLSLFGPALIPLTLALWATLAVLGFGLIYLAGMPGSFAVSEQAAAPTTFADAMYVSGVAFFTLGFGEIVPTSGALRMLSVVQAGAGFALITLSISYFISVYAAFSRQKALAETVYGLSEGGGGAGFVARHRPEMGGIAGLEAELARYRDQLAEIRAAYRDYPIIHYFVPQQSYESLLRLVLVAREITLLLDTAVDAERCPRLAGLGRRTGLEHAASAVTDSLAKALFGGSEAEARRRLEADPLTDEDRARLRECFREGRDRLAGAGVAVREDAEAMETYVARRRVWERVLHRCAVWVGEDWEAVRGGP